MRLDVDCGNTLGGDANVGLLGSDRHRDGIKLVTKKIPNFIYASAHVLSFRNNSFDEVVSFHLLEHCELNERRFTESRSWKGNNEKMERIYNDISNIGRPV